MNRLITEWIDLAEEDYRSLEREFRVRRSPSYSVVCFHCQQCVEKYMKAMLVSLQIEPPRTHNLVSMLDMIVPFQPLWESDRLSFQELLPYSVRARYGGIVCTRDDAKSAVQCCRHLRKLIRNTMGLDS